MSQSWHGLTSGQCTRILLDFGCHGGQEIATVCSVLTVDLFVGERDKQASATGEHVRSCKHALLPAPTLLRRRSRINQCTHSTQNIQPNLLLTAFLPVLLFAGAIALEWHTVRRLLSSSLLLAGALLPCARAVITGSLVVPEEAARL